MGKPLTAKYILSNQAGQTAVEYIMLFAVIATLSYALFNSDRFKEYFGPDSQVFAMIAKKTEWNYRYAGMDDKPEPDYVNGFNPNYNQSLHPSYFWNSGAGVNTRFFVPLEEYPGN